MTPARPSLRYRVLAALARARAEDPTSWVRLDHLAEALQAGRRSIAAATQKQVADLIASGYVQSASVAASALVGTRVVLRITDTGARWILEAAARAERKP